MVIKPATQRKRRQQRIAPVSVQLKGEVEMKGFNGLALLVFFVLMTVSAVLAVILGMAGAHPAWIVGELLLINLIGTYIFIAFRVADQWEKAVVLRLGKFVGLKGPGAVLDRARRRHHPALDRPPGDGHPFQRREDPDQGHRAGGRRRGAVLDGVGCGKGRPGGRGLPGGHLLGGADRPAGDHRPDGPGRYPGRAGPRWTPTCRRSSTSAPRPGASPCSRSRSATSSSPRRWKTP